MSYLAKVAMFTFFVTLLYFAIGIATHHIATLIASNFKVGNNTIYILQRLKICTAVNIYISAVIGTWIVNKIINYWMG